MSAFGRPMLDRWFLDPAFTYLNHGTVGATPRRVLAEQRRIVEEIERQPAQFILRETSNPHRLDVGGEPSRMRRAAAQVAAFVGAPVGDQNGDSSGNDLADGMVFVDNITVGANAVLASLPFDEGDIVAVTNLGYGGVTNAVELYAQRAGASVQVIDLPAPGAPVSAFVAAFTDQLQAGTRLVVIDHLTAFSGLVLPIDAIIEACRAAGALVLIDGAHVPGQLDLRIGELNPDWYVANLHKWAWVPRSAGFLWAAPQHRSSTHAPVVSWGRGAGMGAEFDFPGTRDPSPFLTAPAAFDYRAELGGEEKIRSYTHELIWSSCAYLSDRWQVAFTTPEEMVGSLTTVQLPQRLGSSAEQAEAVRQQLFDLAIEAPIFATSNPAYGVGAEPGLVVRLCAQIYNDESDIERLADAVDSLSST